MVLETAAAVAVCLGLYFLVQELKRWLLTPVRPGEEGSVTAVFTLRGEGKRMEHTLDGLLRLRDLGEVEMDIVLEDGGLTPQGRELAERLAESRRGVSLR